MKTSVIRKVLMALSGAFLMFFLVMHVAINLLSVFSVDAFNQASHFMGYNPVIQTVMQPVLILGVIFHLAMGIILDLQNKKARNIKYAKNNAAANSSWMSRNMIITGGMILFFLIGHMIDFWAHEMNYKYVEGLAEDPTRYWHELHVKLGDLKHLIIYTIAFVFLSLHLMHGFQSAFQSVGFNHNKYTPLLKKLGTAYALIIPFFFIVVTFYHFFTQSH